MFPTDILFCGHVFLAKKQISNCVSILTKKILFCNSLIRMSHGDESIHHRVMHNSANRENISTSGRWHSLDSISQQQLAAKIKTHQKFFLQPQNHHQHGSKK